MKDTPGTSKGPQETENNSKPRFEDGVALSVREHGGRNLRLARTAAETGDILANAFMASLHESGVGVQKDKATAERYWAVAKAAGWTNVMPIAFGMYRAAPDSPPEDPIAISDKGLALLHGDGVPCDAARAVELFKQSGRSGDHRALFHLSMCYMFGKGVERSAEKAAELWQQISVCGNRDAEALALMHLGWAHEFGHGVEMSDDDAIRCYEQAAQKGFEVGNIRVQEVRRLRRMRTSLLFQFRHL